MNPFWESVPKIHLFGVMSLGGYCVAATLLEPYSNLAAVSHFLTLFASLFLFYFLAIRVLTKTTASQDGRLTRQIIFWAVLFRIAILPAGLPRENMADAAWRDVTGAEVVFEQFLLYDNDVWRYLWDGHVGAYGHDPYSLTPAEVERRFDADDPAMADLFEEEIWRDIFDYVAFKNYKSVYPPLSQALFRFSHAVAPGSVLFFKILVALLDLGVCLVLLLILIALKRRSSDILYYAWNPLVLKEYAGSGHLDPLMLLFLLAAFYLMVKRRDSFALLCFGCSILAKLTPIVLLPLFLRRANWKKWPLIALPIILGYAIFWESVPIMIQGLAAFSREWVFNPGIWGVFRWLLESVSLPGEWAGPLGGLVFAGFWLWLILKDRGDLDSLVSNAFFMMAAFLLLSAVVMPWYLPWVLPLAILYGNRSWLALTMLALLSYLIYIDQTERAWWLWLEYGLFFGITGLEFWRMKRRGDDRLPTKIV